MEIQVKPLVNMQDVPGLLVTDDDKYFIADNGSNKFILISPVNLRKYSLDPMSHEDLIQYISDVWGEKIEQFIPVESLVLSVK